MAVAAGVCFALAMLCLLVFIFAGSVPQLSGLSGALRGLGDTRFPLAISLVGMWAVRCTLAPILVFGLKIGLAGSWIAMVCDLCVRGILCTLRFKRFTPQYLAEHQR